MKIEEQIEAYQLHKKGWKGLDYQIRNALDEIEQYSKTLGNLESLDKTKFPFLENTIGFFKLAIQNRNDAIRKFIDSKRRSTKHFDIRVMKN